MPAAFEHLWIQALLLGIALAALGIHNKVNPAIMAVASLSVTFVTYAINALICGIATLDTDPTLSNCIRFGIIGLFGAVYLAFGLWPYFLIVPITVITLYCIASTMMDAAHEQYADSPPVTKLRLSISDLLVGTTALAIACWQLAEFIKHNAF